MRLQRNIEKSWKIYYSCKRAMQRKIKMQSIQKYNLHIKKNHYIFGGVFLSEILGISRCRGLICVTKKTLRLT